MIKDCMYPQYNRTLPRFDKFFLKVFKDIQLSGRERRTGMKKLDRTKLRLAVILLVIAFFSVFVLAGVASSPQFHASTIAALDEKQTTVLELTAASTAASAAITLLPGDTATPIAEKLADLSSGFLLVLCAIYLEKYLLTITGVVTFDFLIPAACLLYLLHLFGGWEVPKMLARKLVIFGLAIVLVIPASVKVSNLIEDTYQTSIDAAVESAKESAGEVEEGSGQLADETEEGFLSGLLSKLTEGISAIGSGISEKVGETVNRLVEALAIMLVTACAIPILVLLFFVWLIKTLFSVDLSAGAAGAYRTLRGKKGDARRTDE